MSASVLVCFALFIALLRFGIAMAAINPMIARTIRSSMRVNPSWRLLAVRVERRDRCMPKRPPKIVSKSSTRAAPDNPRLERDKTLIRTAAPERLGVFRETEEMRRIGVPAAQHHDRRRVES